LFSVAEKEFEPLALHEGYTSGRGSQPSDPRVPPLKLPIESDSPTTPGDQAFGEDPFPGTKKADLHAYVNKLVQAQLATLVSKMDVESIVTKQKDAKIAELTRALRKRTEEAKRCKAETAAMEGKLRTAVDEAKAAQQDAVRAWGQLNKLRKALDVQDKGRGLSPGPSRGSPGSRGSRGTLHRGQRKPSRDLRLPPLRRD
jgi:hypothetical protein